MIDAAIEVQDLTVRYGDRVAVDGLSLSVARGESVALLGPNGAGKTTTVETLEGYRRPDAGTVRVLGLDPLRDHARLVVAMGVMLQEGGVYRAMSPAQALALFASYYPNPRDPDELIELVGLTDERRTPWRNLSGGQRQRLSLALALVGRPEILLLDEPTSGLDPAGRRALREMLAGLAEEGTTVLLTTHDLDEAERCAGRIVVIAEGQVRADGSVRELLQRHGHRSTIRFSGPPGLDTAALAAQFGAPVSEEPPGSYSVPTEPGASQLAALGAWAAGLGVELGDITTRSVTLEDLYLELIGPRQGGGAP